MNENEYIEFPSSFLHHLVCLIAADNNERKKRRRRRRRTSLFHRINTVNARDPLIAVAKCHFANYSSYVTYTLYVRRRRADLIAAAATRVGVDIFEMYVCVCVWRFGDENFLAESARKNCGSRTKRLLLYFYICNTREEIESLGRREAIEHTLGIVYIGL